MKRELICLSAILFTLFSCNKEPYPNAKISKKSFQVNITTTGGTLQTKNDKRELAVPPSLHAKMLYYFVYNSKRKLIQQLVQDSSISNFGKISENLPSGDYTFYIAAGQGGLAINNNSLSYGKYDLPWKDSFFKKVPISISDSDVDVFLQLERIVGQLEFVIEDAIPANAKTLILTINKEYASFNYVEGKWDIANVSTVNIPVTSTMIGAKNFKYTRLITNTATPTSLTIQCKDSKKATLAARTISNVSFKKNTRTIITGKLFSENGKTFNIGVDSTWNEDSNLVIEF